MSDEGKPEEYIIVPKEQISEAALHGLIDEYVLREGTEYGHSESSLEDKRNQILRRLIKGHYLIAYSIAEESTTLIPADKI